MLLEEGARGEPVGRQLTTSLMLHNEHHFFLFSDFLLLVRVDLIFTIFLLLLRCDHSFIIGLAILVFQIVVLRYLHYQNGVWGWRASCRFGCFLLYCFYNRLFSFTYIRKSYEGLYQYLSIIQLLKLNNNISEQVGSTIVYGQECQNLPKLSDTGILKKRNWSPNTPPLPLNLFVLRSSFASFSRYKTLPWR